MGSVVSAIAFPNPPKEYSADELRARPDLKFLQTKSGLKIPAIHIKHPESKFTIIYSHGNAEDVGISLYYLDIVSHVLRSSVIAYEYPGYSISDGEASEKNCYEAIDAAYESLGTGPTVDLCSRSPKIGGCILQSPLESGIRCFIGVCSSYTLYPLDIFRNYSKVEQIKCPVFIMHGMNDNVVPCSNGKAIYAELQERPFHDSVDYPPVWIPGSGHNDMPQDVCLDHSRKFLKFLDRRRKS
eukprot:scaffold7316_cov123-Cylindrotheca_fusiformis.AAC.16